MSASKRKRRPKAHLVVPLPDDHPEDIEYTEEELADAAAEDADRDMYGDDYDYLKIVGWIDRD